MFSHKIIIITIIIIFRFKREALNYDHPKSIDFELLTKHVKALKKGESIEQPLYSFVTHSRTGDYVTVEPKNVLIVEGILVLTNQELLKEFDLKVFVHADSDERLIRRIRRDTRTWQRFARSSSPLSDYSEANASRIYRTF
jgi:uridine kinase